MCILKTPMFALADSGAAISCLNHQAYLKAGLQRNFPLRTPSIGLVKGVCGTPINVLGSVTIPIRIAQLELTQTFHVLDAIQHDIILGLDFLTEQKACLNFDNNTLELQKGLAEVNLCAHNSNRRLHLIRVIGNISLPPRSETVIPVNTRGQLKSEIGLIEPLTSLPSRHHLMGSHCVVSSKQRRFAYKILNPTNESITLKHHEPVGHIQALDPDAIHGSLASEVNQVNAMSTNDPSNTLDPEQYIAIAKDMGVDLGRSDLDPKHC